MKKNIIIIHTDQQRYDSLGCNGNLNKLTPNIDSLAEDGCRFTRHIAASSTCMPSRASLLTGLYVPGHGVTSNGIPLWRLNKNVKLGTMFGIQLPDKVPTLADILGDKGYKTSLIGKLHLEPHLSPKEAGLYESYEMWEDESHSENDDDLYGFQDKKVILGHGEDLIGNNKGHYGRWLQKNHKDIVEIVNKDNKETLKGIREDIYISKMPSKYHNTTWIKNEVCHYLDDYDKDVQPLFMFVGFPDPHRPYTPPEDVFNKIKDIELPEFSKLECLKGEKAKASIRALNQRKATIEDCNKAYVNTMASISLIDDAVGEIIKNLKKNDMYDDSIIIFTSDHGDYLGDLEMLAKSDLPFENLVHIPFIIKGQKGSELPEIMDRPMSNADVVPTLLSLIGEDTPKYIQGVNIYDKKSENNMPMVTCFGVAGDERNVTLYDHRYRYTYFLDTKEEELYDYIIDPKELNNLADHRSDLVTSICLKFKEEVLIKHITCESGFFNHYALW